MRKSLISAALVAAAAVAAPASAATIMTITPTPNPCSGENCSFRIAGSTTDAEFSVTRSFFLPAMGTIASSLVNTRVSSATNIDFTSVFITDPNNVKTFFTLSQSGSKDMADLVGLATMPGTYLLTVAGTSGGRASFGGDISFAGVPEASTWGLLIAGFGVIGFAMRRRNTGAHARRTQLKFI